MTEIAAAACGFEIEVPMLARYARSTMRKETFI
jgi:hypothetical protein